MNITLLGGALVLGFISSAHCIGMCGPLVMALPVRMLPASQKISGLLLYHAGRIGMYTAMGALFGLAGRQFYLAGLQHTLSIVSGCLLLVMALSAAFPKLFARVKILAPLQHLLQRMIIRFMRDPKPLSMAALGAANGLLPCGMVYMAIAGALVSGSVIDGMFFMTCFGLGTLPTLVALSVASWKMNNTFRAQLRNLTPYAGLLLAALLIARGLYPDLHYINTIMHHFAPSIPCTVNHS